MNCCSRLPRSQVGREASPATLKPPLSFSKRARWSTTAPPRSSRARAGSESAGIRSRSVSPSSRSCQRTSQCASARAVTVRTTARRSAWRGLHELAPGRRVVEEVVDHHGGAAVARSGFAALDGAAVELDEAADVVAVGAAGQAAAAHRGDGGQRLAAEAEARHLHDVGDRGDLARRVAFEGQRQLAERDAVAVVLDDQAGEAAVAHGDRDAARAGVQRVLAEFLDDGRRPFDHLAGGDAVDGGVVEHADGPRAVVHREGSCWLRDG